MVEFLNNYDIEIIISIIVLGFSYSFYQLYRIIKD